MPGGGADGHHRGMTKSRPEALCPIRPGERCTLCQVSVTGPQDCGLVYLVMHDEELRQGLRASKLAHSGATA